jgi:hypothetical protein
VEKTGYISRLALIFVLEARQRAKGKSEEGFRFLTFVDISAFIGTYLLSCRHKG